MRKRYLIERTEDGVRVTVHPTPDMCPVCGGRLVEDDTSGRVHCEAQDAHTPEGWLPPPYELPEVETGKGHGFDYGYGGTGSAILAASLVADLFAEQPTHHQFHQGACRAFIHMEPVKWRFVASLDQRASQHWLDGRRLKGYCAEREEPCVVCRGSGRDPEEWCGVCGAAKGQPCQQEDGGPAPHEYSPAPCYHCLGLKVQRRERVAP